MNPKISSTDPAHPVRIAALVYQAQTVIRLLRDSRALHAERMGHDGTADPLETDFVHACQIVEQLLERTAQKLDELADIIDDAAG